VSRSTRSSANTMLSPGHVLRIIEEARPRAFYQGTVGGMRLIDRSLDEVLDKARGLGCVNAVDVVMPHERGWKEAGGGPPPRRRLPLQRQGGSCPHRRGRPPRRLGAHPPQERRALPNHHEPQGLRGGKRGDEAEDARLQSRCHGPHGGGGCLLRWRDRRYPRLRHGPGGPRPRRGTP
jgi:hypothetical protein